MLLKRHECQYILDKDFSSVDINSEYVVGLVDYAKNEVIVRKEMSSDDSIGEVIVDYDNASSTAFSHKRSYEWRIDYSLREFF